MSRALKLLRWGKGAAISTRMRRDARSKGAAWAKAPHRDQDDDELVQRLAKALRIHVSVHPHGRCAGQKCSAASMGVGISFQPLPLLSSPQLLSALAAERSQERSRHDGLVHCDVTRGTAVDRSGSDSAR